MIICVYSFSLFVSSKTRYHAEFWYIESSLLHSSQFNNIIYHLLIIIIIIIIIIVFFNSHVVIPFHMCDNT